MASIFISYNHNDNLLVDTIARRLELEFGRNNITYDRWTMQPGDSIIGKMNEGLSDFTTFFFFVSPNSLASKMVTLEWQNSDGNERIFEGSDNSRDLRAQTRRKNPPSIDKGKHGS